MDEKLEKIKRIIEEITDIPEEEITIASSLINDLDLSSLELLNITNEISREFSKKIPEKIFISFETVGDILKYLEE